MLTLVKFAIHSGNPEIRPIASHKNLAQSNEVGWAFLIFTLELNFVRLFVCLFFNLLTL